MFAKWGQNLRKIKIKTPYIRLGDFLKFASICSSGGDAKAKILSDGVLVNREICRVRGKKLKAADIVNVDGVEYVIRNEGC